MPSKKMTLHALKSLSMRAHGSSIPIKLPRWDKSQCSPAKRKYFGGILCATHSILSFVPEARQQKVSISSKQFFETFRYKLSQSRHRLPFRFLQVFCQQTDGGRLGSNSTLWKRRNGVLCFLRPQYSDALK